MKRVLLSLAAGLCFAAGCASLAGIRNNYRAGHHPDAGNGGSATGGNAGAGGSAGQKQRDASAGSGGGTDSGLGGSAGSGGGTDSGAGGSAGASDAGCSSIDAGMALVTIASMTGAHPGAIAVDCSGVYWTTRGSPNGSLMRAPLGGGAATQLATGTEPYDLALDSTHIYWTDYAANSVHMTDKAAPYNSIVLATGQGQSAPTGIAVDHNNVYWATYNSATVYKMSKVSPHKNVGVVPILKNQTGADGLAVDSTQMFWASGLGVQAAPLSAPDAGVTLTSLAATAVALDTTNVFWRSFDAGASLGWSLEDGGKHGSIAGPTTTILPWGIAADDQYVYWTDYQAGTVNKLAVGSTGTPTRLARNQNSPSGICLYGDYVYWTNAGTSADAGSGGTVMAVHK